MNISGVSTSSDDLTNKFQSTPNKNNYGNSSPSNGINGLLSRILQMTVEVQRKVYLTQEQRDSISDTLEILLALTEKLLTEGENRNASRQVSSVAHLNALVDGIAKLMQPASYSAGPSSQNSATVHPRPADDQGVKYGIFQDRISNLSPSVSTKSIYELKQNGGGELDKNGLLEFDDEFDDEDDFGSAKVPQIGEFRIPQLAYTPNRNITSMTPTRTNNTSKGASRTKSSIRPTYLDYK
ncbi:hypothetical protein CLIB1423_25S00518 [[Candida] railenensis]|uniref:Uncharacterized protein n=1 Tax=[Candida] railenensis TaxID=45579 RepID=A0A9P0QW06_9ASCO|nr:hypothetical protein CLIB1423_25S00518 [[Candida] railenensis]